MKNIVLLLFAILSTPVIAQGLFSPGYIVTAEGDTINGLIYENSDAGMSRRILFRNTETTEIQKFTVHELTAFGFRSGREFEKRALLHKSGRDGDTSYIFAKNILRGQTDVFVGRHSQKRPPEIFLDNNSSQTSIRVFRSRNSDALGVEDFLQLFYNEANSLSNPQGVKFNEKILLQNIATRNENAGGFPVSVYQEIIEHNWDFLIGMPIDHRKEAYHLRGAIYYSRTRPERNSKFSSLHGIVYHHWERKEVSIIGTQQYGEMNTKFQMVNIIPVGIKFQGDSGNLRPYGYIGAGLALLRETNVSLEGITNTEDQITLRFQPTINSGIGIKFKIGKNFLLTELTPTVNNVFFNLGLSI